MQAIDISVPTPKQSGEAQATSLLAPERSHVGTRSCAPVHHPCQLSHFSALPPDAVASGMGSGAAPGTPCIGERQHRAPRNEAWPMTTAPAPSYLGKAGLGLGSATVTAWPPRLSRRCLRRSQQLCPFAELVADADRTVLEGHVRVVAVARPEAVRLAPLRNRGGERANTVRALAVACVDLVLPARNAPYPASGCRPRSTTSPTCAVEGRSHGRTR